jgi:signal transduction histidine kinase
MRREDPGQGAGRTDGTASPGGTASPVPRDRSVITRSAADQVAALAAKAARAPIGLVELIEGPGLLLFGAYGVADRTHDDVVVPVENTLAGVILANNAPLVIEDVATDQRAHPEAPSRAAGGGGYAGYPVYDTGGNVVGVCCVVDTRPRQWTPAELDAVAQAAQVCTILVAERLARAEVDRQRRFLDAVLDSLHDGVAACDADGRVVLTNARMQQMWDRPDKADPDDPAPTRIPPALADLGLRRALRGEKLRGEEFVVEHEENRRRSYVVDGQPITGSSGTTVGAVVALQDVTRRRRAERFRTCELAVTTALAEAPNAEHAGPRVLEAVVTTLGWVHAELWLADEAAQELRSAARWSAPGRAAALQVPATLQYGQGLAGRAWQAEKPLWIRDVGRPQSLIAPDKAISAGLHTALAIPVRDGTGTLGVLTLFADHVEDPEDELVALLGGIAAQIGIFLEHRMVEQLQRQLARSKDEYLALVSHELRTPLTSISAYTGLLREADAETLASQGPAMLEVLDRNTAQLRQIIDDLIELSALDTGHATMQAAPFDLAAEVRESVEAACSGLDTVALTVSADVPDDLVVPGDRRRLRQVVDNLVGNAIKYSPDGGRITVRLSRSQQAAELTVSDTGIGIPPEERGKLFNQLYRSDRVRERAIPGSGLGLALSRAVVEAHHGTIALADHEGPGTTIRLRLPAEPR